MAEKPKSVSEQKGKIGGRETKEQTQRRLATDQGRPYPKHPNQPLSGSGDRGEQ